MTTAAETLWKDGDPAAALNVAWAAGEKSLVANILWQGRQLLTAADTDRFIDLLRDPEIDPGAISASGWTHLLRDTEFFTGDASAVAARLEQNALALTLLREDVVSNIEAERGLTAVRRHLLLTRTWSSVPMTTKALLAQAGLNGGAWPFEEDERAQLPDSGEFSAAYRPRRVHMGRSAALYDNPITRAVAEQYEAWPYPQWTRITQAKPSSLATVIAKIDPEGPSNIASPSDILIAGCGSGKQVAKSVNRMPGERFTAIDLSQASLDDAASRCAMLGIHGVTYRAMDLHDVAQLHRRFDAIFCTGVLHHLPNPEKGWEALTRVLKPGGVMRVMVYSRVARMRLAAIRRSLGALLDQRVDDDLLREVRRRVMTMPALVQPRGADFSSLAGVHDLLLHRHEDLFDLPRIRRALDALGLKLLRFELPTETSKANYRKRNPGDVLQRDFDGWWAMERANPQLFGGMYDFWCRKLA